MKSKIIIGAFMLFLSTGISVSSAKIHPYHTSKLSFDFYSDKIQQALALLEQHPKYKEYVEKHLSIVKKGRLTRIFMFGDNNVMEITDKFINNMSVPWLASTFVHEAAHVELYNPYASDQLNEINAIGVQIVALREMGGEKWELLNLMSQDGMHFDSNGNGVLDPDDDWGH